MLDEKDLKILSILEKDSRKTVQHLGEILSIPRATIHNRIKKLERLGIIRTYKAIVDYKKLGMEITALLHINISSEASTDLVINWLKSHPFVEDIFIVTGQYDIIAKIKVRDTKELGSFLFDSRIGLRTLAGVERTESIVVVDTIREYGLESS